MLSELQTLMVALPHKLYSLSVMLLLVALVFVIAERTIPLHASPTLRKSWLTDLGYYFLGGLVPAFVMVLVVHLTVLVLRPLGPMPWHAWVAGMPSVSAFLASVMLSELAYYWAHRLAHGVPLLWRFHSVHHSPAHVDWLVNTRTHPLDLSFMRGFIFVCLYILGFSQRAPDPQNMAPVLYSFWMTTWAFFVHANVRLRMGCLEYLVSSPAFHHWHHVKGEPALVDKNFAATQPWLDMLFGTFYLPKQAWPQQYGIDDALAPGMWGQLVNPLRGRQVRQMGPAAVHEVVRD